MRQQTAGPLPAQCPVPSAGSIGGELKECDQNDGESLFLQSRAHNPATSTERIFVSSAQWSPENVRSGAQFKRAARG